MRFGISSYGRTIWEKPWSDLNCSLMFLTQFLGDQRRISNCLPVCVYQHFHHCCHQLVSKMESSDLQVEFQTFGHSAKCKPCARHWRLNNEQNREAYVLWGWAVGSCTNLSVCWLYSSLPGMCPPLAQLDGIAGVWEPSHRTIILTRITTLLCLFCLWYLWFYSTRAWFYWRWCTQHL